MRASLASGGELWFTNVLVFALWYWRLDGGGPTIVINVMNSAAVALFFRKCRSKKLSAAALSARGGILISSTIFLSPGRPVRLSVRPTRLYSPAGQRFSP